MIYANCGAIAVTTSTTYVTIMELFDEYSSPFSPEVIRSFISPHFIQPPSHVQCESDLQSLFQPLLDLLDEMKQQCEDKDDCTPILKEKTEDGTPPSNENLAQQNSDWFKDKGTLVSRRDRRYGVDAWVVCGYSTKVLSRYRHANCYILIRTSFTRNYCHYSLREQ